MTKAHSNKTLKARQTKTLQLIILLASPPRLISALYKDKNYITTKKFLSILLSGCKRLQLICLPPENLHQQNAEQKKRIDNPSRF
jgi:hypothetical protein